MAYAKLPLPCVDYPFGFDDFNQLVANNVAHLASLTAEHGSQPHTSSPAAPWQRMGNHNGIRVARTVIKATPVQQGATRLVELSIAGPALHSIESPAVGDVRIKITGLGRFRARAFVEGLGSTPVRMVSLSWSQAAATVGIKFLGLLLHEDGALADFPFYVVINET